MILGIHHVAISVPDLKRALEFYCGVLGFEALWSLEVDGDDEASDRAIGLPNVSASIKMLRAGNAYVELWEYVQPIPKSKDPDYPPSDHGIAHFALQVTDIQSEHRRLSAAGMRFVGPPVDFGTQAAVYGRDPFGNIIEIYEISDPSVPQITVPAR